MCHLDMSCEARAHLLIGRILKLVGYGIHEAYARRNDTSRELLLKVLGKELLSSPETASPKSGNSQILILLNNLCPLICRDIELAYVPLLHRVVRGRRLLQIAEPILVKAPLGLLLSKFGLHLLLLTHVVVFTLHHVVFSSIF